MDEAHRVILFVYFEEITATQRNDSSAVLRDRRDIPFITAWLHVQCYSQLVNSQWTLSCCNKLENYPSISGVRDAFKGSIESFGQIFGQILKEPWNV
jgi:hypothetical protein